ncbi:hypothetical protein [Hoylesella shahii]|jgi:hypothetical protein|uniref:hypothetical protein n=1 Tax=Hoylesella shahii TaxID=228603 RepID=UPI00204B4EFB|nr:hypothetical protein [Hoylesella shahii]DAV47239.1 MAG TPA: hypothetical protein [Caudoviricetes sp.]
MIQNNNFTPLAFQKEEEWLNHNKSYAFGAIYNLFSPNSMLLPFQIVRPHRNDNIGSVELYTRDGELVSDITNDIISLGLVVKPFELYGYDVIVYPAYLPLNINVPLGIFYIKISDGVDTWCSEMLTNVSSVDGYVKVEWWDNEDFLLEDGRIVYSGLKYHNVVYLNSKIGKPEYKFVEEGETRDGYFFPEKQLSEKVYKFTFIAPEYLCDAMRFIRMADNVLITDEVGREYDCDTFLMSTKWQTQGDLASVEVEFETATIAKKIGSFQTVLKGGDFNGDFNNDFSTDNGVSMANVILEFSVYKNDFARISADTSLVYDVKVTADVYLINGEVVPIVGVIPAGQSVALVTNDKLETINYFDNMQVEKLNNVDNTNYIIKQK